jgi:hypothetical protein
MQQAMVDYLVASGLQNSACSHLIAINITITTFSSMHPVAQVYEGLMSTVLPALCSAPLSRYGTTVVPAAPELEALLAAAEASEGQVSLEQLQALFSFKLDDFQAQAVQVLLQGRSVVVCAPTGECPMTGCGL